MLYLYMQLKRFLTNLCLLFTILIMGQTNNYEIGIGISDVTGQIVQSNFFGYGNPFFRNSGIKDRQYARAFIIKEPEGAPLVFVIIDKGAIFQSVNQAVIDQLSSTFGSLYTDKNIILSANHTHVSPGGFSCYQLYNLATGGHFSTNFNILVQGIVRAIKQAHLNISPGRIYYHKGILTNASINRSLSAYNLNKDANAYPSIDEEMTILKFIQGNRAVGILSWFAVHPTNLSKNYKLCSGDNKGYASIHFERNKGTDYRSEHPRFIAAFANSNAGDLSPNLNQPSINDKFTDAFGPGKNEEESVAIIGQRQYKKAMELFNNASIQLKGSIAFVSRYSDFSKISIAPKFTDDGWKQTCKAALGKSFIAGAEDGRTGFGNEGIVRKNLTSGSSNEQCHMEKPIHLLFNIGANDSNPRAPKILATSLFKIGQLGILSAPGEFTVMAGRRVRKVVSSVPNTGIQYTVFSGYSDGYAGYVTTREEYASQQYEGASTHFGPWTCAAFQQEFERLSLKLANPSSEPWPVTEPKVPTKSFEGIDKTAFILFDDKPLFKSFGSVIKAPNNSYLPLENVSVEFWGAHPNNNPLTNSSYLEIQQLIKNKWVTKYEDRDNSTKMEWERSGIANSKIKISWKIPNNIQRGVYRVLHRGYWKNGWNGTIKPYQGISESFEVSRRRKTSGKYETKIYPNPAKDYFQFTNPYGYLGIVSLLNSIGQKVLEQSIGSNKIQQVYLSSLPKGIYFVHIQYHNQTPIKSKLIKL